MMEENASEEDIQKELAIIHAQLGYIYLMQNKPEEAMQLYNSVLKSK